MQQSEADSQQGSKDVMPEDQVHVFALIVLEAEATSVDSVSQDEDLPHLSEPMTGQGRKNSSQHSLSHSSEE